MRWCGAAAVSGGGEAAARRRPGSAGGSGDALSQGRHAMGSGATGRERGRGIESRVERDLGAACVCVRGWWRRKGMRRERDIDESEGS